MENKIQILQKFYKFDYPVYSGTSIKCIKCQNEEWISGQEFRDNINSYLVDLFQHKHGCSVNDQLQKSINELTDSQDKIWVSDYTWVTMEYQKLSENFIRKYKIKRK